MAVSLTITDRADGTGADAVITGTDPAALNTVEAVADRYPGTWSYINGRTGDGALALPMTPGYHWIVCRSVKGQAESASTPQRAVVTRSPEAVHYGILKAVEAAVRDMAVAGALPDVKPERVYLDLALDEANKSFPCVALTANDREADKGGTNATDNVGFPVVVHFCDRNAMDHRKLGTYLLHRERLATRFRSQRLPGVPRAFECLIEYDAIIDPKLPAYQYLVSAFVLRFTTKVIRDV